MGNSDFKLALLAYSHTFFLFQSLPLEKMLQVDPLTWTLSRGPRGAALGPLSNEKPSHIIWYENT